MKLSLFMLILFIDLYIDFVFPLYILSFLDYRLIYIPVYTNKHYVYKSKWPLFLVISNINLGGKYLL